MLRIIGRLEDVEEGLRQFYEKRSDGKFHLKIEDGDDGDKSKEFRENNIRLMRENDELKKTMERFKGIDPEKHAKALKALEKMESEDDRKMLSEGQFEELLQKRTARIRESYEERLKEVNTEQSKLKESHQRTVAEYSELRLGQEARTILAKKKFGLIPGAEEDLIARLRPNYTYDIESKKFKARDGLYNPKTGETLTLEDWFDTLPDRAPHLILPAEGGGTPGDRNSTTTTRRPGQTIPIEDLANNLEDVASGKLRVTGTERLM